MNPVAAEVTKTVFLYNPSDAVTVTVTETPTVSLQTKTFGRPWTTATGFIYTRTLRYPTPTVEVVHQYPVQPQFYMQSYCHQDKRAGAIAAAFFGGMGAGMVFLVLGVMIWRWRRRVREAQGGRVQLRTEGSVEYGFDPLGNDGTKTPLLADVEGGDASIGKKQTGTGTE